MQPPSRRAADRRPAKGYYRTLGDAGGFGRIIVVPHMPGDGLGRQRNARLPCIQFTRCMTPERDDGSPEFRPRAAAQTAE
jgi:hypothetical protein